MHLCTYYTTKPTPPIHSFCTCTVALTHKHTDTHPRKCITESAIPLLKDIVLQHLAVAALEAVTAPVGHRDTLKHDHVLAGSTQYGAIHLVDHPTERTRHIPFTLSVDEEKQHAI